MPPDLNQWGNFLTSTGLLGGSIIIIYGYFKGLWLSGTQAQAEKDALQKQIDQVRADLADAKQEFAARLLATCSDYDNRIALLRQEHAQELARARAREARWETAVLKALEAGVRVADLVEAKPPEGT